MKMKNAFAGVAAVVAMAGAVAAQPHETGAAAMGGYGSGYGMGPGMMGDGYGMDRGTMGGGYGMGGGMMVGYGPDAYAGLDLTPEQQKAIGGIQEQASKAMRQLMGTMHGQGYHMQGMFGTGALDEAAARKSFQTMAETRKAMFELQLDTRKKIDAVLTKEQREQLRRYWSSRQ
jgi:Spy/CpxP family protein refolding chaperone